LTLAIFGRAQGAGMGPPLESEEATSHVVIVGDQEPERTGWDVLFDAQPDIKTA
jgi:hypothetical protein